MRSSFMQINITNFKEEFAQIITFHLAGIPRNWF
jgi:hypothetical protein